MTVHMTKTTIGNFALVTETPTKRMRGVGTLEKSYQNHGGCDANNFSSSFINT